MRIRLYKTNPLQDAEYFTKCHKSIAAGRKGMSEKKKLFAASILSAFLAAGAFAALGSTTTTMSAFAQVADGQDGNSSQSASGNATSAAASSNNTTSTASSNNTTVSGVIASLQNNEMGAPVWITAGHWKLESDSSLFDNSTKPTITNFSATIYMASITNGSSIHRHEITDFTQTDVLHSGDNSTTINGTMTVSMSDGPHQNTSGYVHLQNNRVSIWLEPAGLGEEHFGPTPIYGLILPDSHKMDDHGDDDWGDDSRGSSTGGYDDSDDRQSSSNSTSQGSSSGGNDDDGSSDD